MNIEDLQGYETLVPLIVVTLRHCVVRLVQIVTRGAKRGSSGPASESFDPRRARVAWAKTLTLGKIT